MRSFAAGFIFTTSLPPAIVAGALASVRHLKSSDIERKKHQLNAKNLIIRFNEAGIKVMPTESHIVPVLVGDPVLCKSASDILLKQYKIYVQPINYPTVPRGKERLRFTPTPLHTDEMISHLINSMKNVWKELNII